ncbi:unnamed protein product [Miscanthus lutarioriparius]|uniref:Uncharacterized protein n=1 Tax=Miscanthus lutarioriparius TaxID=422564 RepID=A0A811N424_9POAL|nr:unnamed protein product [Miscanthus lutarioriparius]
MVRMVYFKKRWIGGDARSVAVTDSRSIHEGGHQAKCKGPISPVRAARATAAAAEMHADTQASSTENTMSTTDTVSANGIDILPALPVLDPGS